MKNDLPQARPILERLSHGSRSASFTVEYDCEFTPGQFVMVWLPGVDEKPFSISRWRPGRVEFTIRRLGAVSDRMADLQEGDLVGVRGPYGHGFSWHESACFVSGGVGLAAVAPLMERLPEAPSLYGENTASDRLFAERFPDLRFFTVDGSSDATGFPTDALPDVIEERRPEIVYACGPEIMLRKVASICHDTKTPCEISLERYMKCAMGVCGQCSLDGERVCADGPVFTGERLLAGRDFGFRRLDKSGTWESASPHD